MKLFKIALIATGLFSLLSCSTSNENNTTIVAPVPPTNLKGSNKENSKITLTWTDNSTNETEFKIERKTGSEIYKEIGSTQTNITEFVDVNIINGVSYTYRVYAVNSAGNSPTYSNEISITPLSLPILSTTPPSNTTLHSTIAGGNITDTGGLQIISRGVVWSTLPNPTIGLPTKTIDGTGAGYYKSDVNSLTSNTTYYIRSYATNSKGTAYGNEVVFKTLSLYTIGGGLTDNCGNIYSTIIINGKEWMQKNLDVCKYRNGDVIPQVQDPVKWQTLTTGAWCYYDFVTSNGVVHGKLYNGYALNDPRGIAPAGWHVSTSDEWNELITYLGGNNIAAERLREKGTANWTNNTSTTSNESGFTALPSGYLCACIGKPSSSFNGKGYLASYWTTSSKGPYYIQSISVNGYYNGSNFSSGSADAKDGYSIRCVKN